MIIFRASLAILLLTMLCVSTSVQAQGTSTDLRSCTDNLNYCSEWARRRGEPDTSCQAAYQDCMRRGTWSRQDPYSPQPRQVPVERR